MVRTGNTSRGRLTLITKTRFFTKPPDASKTHDNIS